MTNDCRSLTPTIPETDDPQIKYFLNSFQQLEEKEQELALKEEELAVKEQQLKEYEKKILDIKSYLKNDFSKNSAAKQKLSDLEEMYSKNKKKKY